MNTLRSNETSFPCHDCGDHCEQHSDGRSESRTHSGAHHSDEDVCSCGHESVRDGSRFIRCGTTVALMLAGIIIPDFGPLLMGESLAAWSLHIAGWLVAGYDIALQTLRHLSKGNVFDENFLMTIATIGAFCIGATAEAVAVMVFYQAGEAFSARAVRKSRNTISQLCDIRPDFATVIAGRTEQSLPVERVLVGDIILIRPGERIPLDAEVLDGVSTADCSSLTGESLPRAVTPGMTILAGTVNKTGVLTARVSAPASDTVAARMLRLVGEAASRKAPVERFITNFAKVYTPVVIGLAVTVAVFRPLLFSGSSIYDAIYSALVFLVTSCPCALVISVPLTYFAGVGGAARAGILVKGSSSLDTLAKASLVIFDKTGTLTEGRFTVLQAVPAAGVEPSTLNRCAAIAEMRSHHPLAGCLREYCGDVGYPADRYLEMPGLGVAAQFEKQIIHAGSAFYMHGLSIKVPDVEGTVVHVALDGRAVGYYLMSDRPRSDSRTAISQIRRLGLKTSMLTGDTQNAAEYTAKELGIDNFTAGLLPDGKLSAMEAMMEGEKGATVFVGDGLNDAAVLARADVGVAMGLSGVDAALEAADVVLMSDKPSQLAVGIVRARATRAIATQNIVFSLCFKLAVLTLGTIGIAPLWLAIAADVGVSLVAVLNAIRARF